MSTVSIPPALPSLLLGHSSSRNPRHPCHQVLQSDHLDDKKPQSSLLSTAAFLKPHDKLQLWGAVSVGGGPPRLGWGTEALPAHVLAGLAISALARSPSGTASFISGARLLPQKSGALISSVGALQSKDQMSQCREGS